MAIFIHIYTLYIYGYNNCRINRVFYLSFCIKNFDERRFCFRSRFSFGLNPMFTVRTCYYCVYICVLYDMYSVQYTTLSAEDVVVCVMIIYKTQSFNVFFGLLFNVSLSCNKNSHIHSKPYTTLSLHAVTKLFQNDKQHVMINCCKRNYPLNVTLHSNSLSIGI